MAFVEEGMVVVVEGLEEEECLSITELAEGGIMELEEGILEEVDMEGEVGLEGVVGDMVEWEDQGISSSMELWQG